MFKKREIIKWNNLKDKALADKLRDYKYKKSKSGDNYVDYDGNVYLTEDGAKDPFIVVHEGIHRKRALNGDLMHNKTLNKINDRLSDAAPALAFINGFNGGPEGKTILHRVHLSTPRTLREGVVNYESRKKLPKKFHGDSYVSDASYAIGTLNEIDEDLKSYNKGRGLRGIKSILIAKR